MQVPTSLWRSSPLLCPALPSSSSSSSSLTPSSPLPANFPLFKSHPHVSLLSPPPAPPLQNGSSTPLSISLTSSNAVLFRNAPWKSHVGHWLSSCYSNSLSLPIHEPIFNQSCPNECNFQGICNHADGQCRCFHGYGGPDCRDLKCNLEASLEWPYGRWVVSICSAYCDKRRAFCFCGSGTKYPEHPVAEACGFKLKVVLYLSSSNDNK